MALALALALSSFGRTRSRFFSAGWRVGMGIRMRWRSGRGSWKPRRRVTVDYRFGCSFGTPTFAG